MAWYNVTKLSIGSESGRTQIDLTTQKSLGAIDAAFGGFRVNVVDGNVPLSARLLHFALSRGILTVLNETEGVSVAGMPTNAFAAVYFDRGLSPRSFIVPDLAVDSIRSDLAIAASARIPLITPDYEERTMVRAWNDSARDFDSGYSEVLALTLAEWRPTSLNEIFAAVDSGALFKPLMQRTRDVIERRSHENEVRLFLPKWGLDLATGGVSSLVEMLVKILRRRPQRR